MVENVVIEFKQTQSFKVHIFTAEGAKDAGVFVYPISYSAYSAYSAVNLQTHIFTAEDAEDAEWCMHPEVTSPRSQRFSKL